MSLISSYIGNGLFNSWRKEKGERDELDTNTMQADAGSRRRLALNSFDDHSSTEASSVSTPTTDPFALSRSTTPRKLRLARSTNPFDEEESKNPFEEDV